MKLLNKPISKQEKDNMLDSLNGNICRICVSDDVSEIIAMLGFATERLSMLAYSRILALEEANEDNNK